jgi:hypothetical protein
MTSSPSLKRALAALALRTSRKPVSLAGPKWSHPNAHPH